MAVETSPSFAPPEASEQQFEHTSPYHQLETAIARDWEEKGLPVRQATVQEDEQGSFRSTRGFDLLVSNIPVDLTAGFQKYERETLRQSAPGSQEKVVVHVPLSDRQFKGKTVEQIMNDPKTFNQLSRATMQNLLVSLPPQEAKQLMARLESRISRVK